MIKENLWNKIKIIKGDGLAVFQIQQLIIPHQTWFPFANQKTIKMMLIFKKFKELIKTNILIIQSSNSNYKWKVCTKNSILRIIFKLKRLTISNKINSKCFRDLETKAHFINRWWTSQTLQINQQAKNLEKA